MNNKGMIITSLLYAILVLFVLVLFSIVLTVSIRKNIMDNVADRIEEEMDYTPPVITGQKILPVFSSPAQTFTAADYAAGLTATDNLDGDLTSSIVCVKPATTINCTVTDRAGNTSAIFARTTTSVAELKYKYTGSYQTFTAAHTGTYEIRIWGAQGGSNGVALGGKGAYIKANIFLTGGQVLYIYVGQHPNSYTAAYNGGGAADNSYSNRAGGGATDIRLIGGAWDDETSLRSRIMVAAGGGGATGYVSGAAGGAAGILTGYAGSNYCVPTCGTYTNSTGATQLNGGAAGYSSSYIGSPGQFGIGGSGTAGGGGGYYGGGGGSWNNNVVGSGAGGSSFVSGTAGFDAVDESGNNTGASAHYSGIVFLDNVELVKYDGTSASVPNQNLVGTQTGNAYSGYARIKLFAN